MCLGIPMRVVAVDGSMARCEARGVTREVSLSMLEDDPAAIGDHVLVHVGYAIQKLSDEEAHSAWEAYDEYLAAERELDDGEGRG